jgi:hypothetical protein
VKIFRKERLLQRRTSLDSAIWNHPVEASSLLRCDCSTIEKMMRSEIVAANTGCLKAADLGLGTAVSSRSASLDSHRRAIVSLCGAAVFSPKASFTKALIGIHGRRALAAVQPHVSVPDASTSRFRILRQMVNSPDEMCS